MLKLLKLDYVYTQARGENLFFTDDTGNLQQVCDFLGGYGSTILGHNLPALVALQTELLQQHRAVHAQASIRSETVELAKFLNACLKNEGASETYYLTLANSGAEVVEAAVKHALMEWQRKREDALLTFKSAVLKFQSSGQVIPVGVLQKINAYFASLQNLSPVLVGFKNSFHGKTAAAVALTDNVDYRAMYSAQAIKVDFWDAEGEPSTAKLAELDHNLHLPGFGDFNFSAIAGVIYEPIQGEGGINEIRAEILSALRPLMQARKIPLIADEIQSGLFRTGRLLESTRNSELPDYILLGKSLGGGLVKIGALLIAASHYQKHFGWIHSSTFAEDDPSSKIALEALKILQSRATDLSARADRFENFVRQLGTDLQAKFPGVIRKIKGRGFFMGFEFNFDEDAPLPSVLHFLYQNGHASYLYASYLLRQYRLRVGVALSAPDTIRFEPCADISAEALKILELAFTDLCEIIYHRRLLKLTSHLWNTEFLDSELAQSSPPRSKRDLARPEELQIGFLAHVIDVGHARRCFDPVLSRVPEKEYQRFLDKYADPSGAARYHQQRIRGENGQSIVLHVYALWQQSAYFEKQLRAGSFDGFHKVQAALDLAVSQGVKYVGLGQFTSIVTDNGRLLNSRGVGLTTGNSLTAGLALQGIEKTALAKGLVLQNCKVGVIGFVGDICNVLTQCLADKVRSMLLVHREPFAQSPRFQKALADLLANSKIGLEQITTAHTLDDLPTCDIVVVGTNSVLKFLGPENFKKGAVVLDVSVPSNVTDEAKVSQDLSYFQAGLAKLPYDQVVEAAWLPLARGDCYACMAETITMGLQGRTDSYSMGRAQKAKVLEVLTLADQVGVRLGNLRTALY